MTFNTQDMYAALKAAGYTDQVNSALKKLLGVEGYASALNEAHHNWLGSKGYTGQYSERLNQWAAADYVISGADTTAPILNTLVVNDAAGSIDYNSDEAGTAHWLIDSTASYADADALVAAKGAAETSGSYTASIGSNSDSLDISGAGDGSWKISVGIIDAAGNASNVLTDDIDIDRTAPAFVSATINGDTMSVTFGETLDIANDTSPSDWSATEDAVGVTITAAAINVGSPTIVDFTLSADVGVGTTILISYSGTTLRDALGNATGSFTDNAVTNTTTGGITISRSTKVISSNTSGTTWAGSSFTPLTAGTDRLILAIACVEGSGTAATTMTIDFGGVDNFTTDLTLLGGNRASVGYAYLKQADIPSGAQTPNMTFNQTMTGGALYLLDCTGVDQTTPTGANASSHSNGSSTTISSSLTPNTTDSAMVSAAVWRALGTTHLPVTVTTDSGNPVVDDGEDYQAFTAASSVGHELGMVASTAVVHSHASATSVGGRVGSSIELRKA